MLEELLTYIGGQLTTILTGLVMMILGISFYKARDGFFLVTDQFRGKLIGLVVLLVTVGVISMVTPLVSRFWQTALPDLSVLQIVALVALLGMVAVNREADWNFFDWKSLAVYAVSLVVLMQPSVPLGL